MHPGGLYFKGKDSWGIPKGEIDVENGENVKDLLGVALREFEEETGIKLKIIDTFVELGNVKRASRKIVHALAVLGNGLKRFIKSNDFEMEWSAGSG